MVAPDIGTKFHVCTLCEAGCGLAVDVEGAHILRVRPNDNDVFSRGFICPKGVAAASLENDPDRLRTPVRRHAGGVFHPISWSEAFDLVAARLGAIRSRHGRDAIAVYMGTPVVHKYSALLMRGALLRALKTRNSMSAGSQDTNPRFVASYYLYGSVVSIPVPDIERTQYLLCIGANPLVSNGSLLTAPNMRGRLRAIQGRGGKVVVVDPRRSETAKVADEHVAIKPGGDAALLLSMLHVLLERGRVDEKLLARIATGWDAIAGRIRAFSPARVEHHTGVPAATVERLANEFADAPTSVAYSRIGVCNNAFGTLATYACDLLNLAVGRLGAKGGALFPTPAIDLNRLARATGADGFARFRSRVRRLPETAGDVPASTLAEEIETPGEGQVRALITFAGNPVLTTPNGRRVAAALEKLDFMVSIDLYINETTRHADVILPPAGSFSEDHVDLFFANVAVRNMIRWSPPAVEKRDDERFDWEILLELAERLGGGATGVPWFDRILRRLRPLGVRWTPGTTMSLALRLGPYGDRFLPGSGGLSPKKVRDSVHGVDLGPLELGFERRVFHADKRIHLAHPPLLASMAELSQQLDRAADRGELLMIGRRELRSNNSWMHNIPALVSGKQRCILYVHPADAERAAIKDGDRVELESRIHRGEVIVHVTDEMREGVVSLPHGYGHAPSASWQRVAGQHAGVSANDWTDDQLVESVVGQSILNGVPVKIRPLSYTIPPSS